MVELLPGVQVWARNAFRKNVYWPAVVVDAEADAPETVRKSAVPGRVCVMYYGPSTTTTRQRDWYWRAEEDILEWVPDAGEMQEQGISSKDTAPFRDALDEARSVESGSLNHLAHTTGKPTASRKSAQRQQVCTSCTAVLKTDDEGKDQGGRCSYCHRLYAEGHYCKVCNKVWLQDNKEMVACDRCNFWIHIRCDLLATQAYKATEANQPCAYFCPVCRESLGRNERMRLVYDYEERLREAKPGPRPESAVEIFKNYLNKNYSQVSIKVEGRNMEASVEEFWKTMPTENRAEYQEQAEKQNEAYQTQRREYQKLLAEFTRLAESVGHPVPADLELDDLKRASLGLKRPPDTSLDAYRDLKQPCVVQPTPQMSQGSGYRGRPFGPHKRRGGKSNAMNWHPGVGSHRQSAFSHFNPMRVKNEEVHGEVGLWHNGRKAESNTTQEENDGVVQKIPIVCNNIPGTFLLGLQKVICGCSTCSRSSEDKREFTATQFEQHCGAGSAKKWKSSLRIRPGAVPEVPEDSAPLPLGKWFDMKGIETKSSRSAGIYSRGSHSGVGKLSLKYDKHRERKLVNGRSKSEKPKVEVIDPWLQVLKGGYSTLKVRYAGDRCAVCDGDIDYDCDQLVTCDSCGMSVHQTCYGIPDAPKNDQIWLCSVCQTCENGNPRPQCCLCPVEGGALKPTDMPGLWAHVACMQWIPEVTVGDPARMEPIQRIEHIQKGRWELGCCLCKQRMGAKIQCLQCYSAYHPLCARMAGLHMEMEEGNAGLTGPLRLVTYCPKHCKPRPELAGIHKMKEEEGNEEVVLFNRQPYKQPPAVEVPPCSSGCARAQLLANWVRVSHGTGAGFSTTKAFWIPETPKVVPRQLYHPNLRQHVPSRVRKSRSGFNRPSRASAKKDRIPHGPVELFPLPKGVPEAVTVECNGRKGTLILRTQRVSYMGEEVAASRFEQMCGKGEAKKWKCSLWYVGDSGQPEMQMQEWLQQHNLDRKVLASLQSNMVDYDVYQQYQDGQVEEVLAEVVDSVAAKVEGTSEAGRGGQDGLFPSVKMESDSVYAQYNGVPIPDHPLADSMETTPENTEENYQENPDSPIKLASMAMAASSKSLTALHIPRDVQVQPKQETVNAHVANGGVNVWKQKKGTSDDMSEDDLPPQTVEEVNGVDDAMETDSDSGKLDGSCLSGNKEDGSHAEALDCDTEEIHHLVDAAGPSGMTSARGRMLVRIGSRVQEAQTASPVLQCVLRRTDSAIKPDLSDPAACIGQCCKLYWPDDDEWYSATIQEYDEENGAFQVLYDMDGEVEKLDLVKELEDGRMRWVVKGDSAVENPRQRTSDNDTSNPATCMSDPTMPPTVPASRDATDCDESTVTKSVIEEDGRDSVEGPSGRDAIGRRASVWWNEDKAYYSGMVDDYDEEKGKYHIRYDDGDVEWIDLKREVVKWEGRAVQSRPRRVQNGTSHAGDSQPTTPKPKANVPDEVGVICNGLEAKYIVKRTAVVTKDGSELTPTEFERVAGKGSSKKWKASIRMQREDGSPGITLGDWLVDQGLDVQRRSSRGSDDEPRHRAPRKISTAERRKPHRDNCMCIICKQARRKALVSQYPSYPSHEPPPGLLKLAGLQSWRPATTAAATRAVGPKVRSGKRAYVTACPQFVRGVVRREPQDVPESRAWDPEEWIKRRKGHVGLDECDDGKDRKVIRSKEEAWRLELEECMRTERERITFGKSGIHGWGLFARRDLPQDSMIIEYRGEVVSPAVADQREKQYKEQEMDCYLFHINDDNVIDATVTGAIGRFTNHCCAPSLYTKILQIDGKYHLCFFARKDIKSGQELTYDYRFKEEAAENKIHCQCGAPNCRGFMN